jgi:hypothetical protein
MIPISEDSTSVMVILGPKTRARAAAVIQPAVPPPAMTIDLISAFMDLASQKKHPPAAVPAGVVLEGARVD